MLKKPRISVVALQIVFSAMWLAERYFSPESINVNEARGISQMSPDPLSRRWGLGTRLLKGKCLRSKQARNLTRNDDLLMYQLIYYKETSQPHSDLNYKHFLNFMCHTDCNWGDQTMVKTFLQCSTLYASQKPGLTIQLWIRNSQW